MMEPSLVARSAEINNGLQWGHRLSAMETTQRRVGRTLPACSFNGATAFQRWKRRKPGGCRHRHRPFNGATAFQRWKPGTLDASLRAVVDLQWGHRLSAMETNPIGWGWTLLSVLQWGHRLSAMETWCSTGWSVPGARPSMGPPPFSDGNLVRRATVHHAVPPSMGATAFQRWKPVGLRP